MQFCHSEAPVFGARNLHFLAASQEQIPRSARNDKLVGRYRVKGALRSLHILRNLRQYRSQQRDEVSPHPLAGVEDFLMMDNLVENPRCHVSYA
jgi:hypothetical protein